jgi:hypothetical protein
MNIEKATQLLQEFETIPFTIKESTHLEICKYPKRRFEEICSRLLSFYFDPQKEHNFNDLFINSFFELLQKDVRYDPKQIEIITEDNAEGKRIDLVIACSDFAIGIENKITASLYNPLATYKKRLEQYRKDENLFKIVLSLFEITKPNEVSYMKAHGFYAITYTQFFDIIKKNIGQYISTCNQKYLTHLFDFIQTLENMKTDAYSNKELSDFFFDNESQIQKLTKAYNAHKQAILEIHKDKMSEIHEKIKNQTNGNWWLWQGWDLGINSFNSRNLKLGIEASFSASKEKPFDKFRIYFTTWKTADYTPYREILKSKFPLLEPDDKSVKNRVYLHMAPIEGENTEEIIQKLKEYYSLLLEITKE